MLTEEELKHANIFKGLIDKNGVTNTSEFIFKAGIVSNSELMKIYDWLREQGWDKIDEVIKADNQAIYNTLHPEPAPKKEVKSPKKFSKDLDRRISNAFDLSEIRKLGIKRMTPEEAEKLLAKRESERRNGR